MLSSRGLKGLVKLGDVLVPKNPPFPSFSETGCVAFVGIALKDLPPKDLRDLKAFLRAASFFPNPLIFLMLKIFDAVPLADLRKAGLRLKALAMSLYYSGKASPAYDEPSPLALIGCRIQRVPR